MARAVVDEGVADHQVVRVVVDAAEGPAQGVAGAADLEAFEHDVVGEAKLDGVGAAAQVRALAVDADPAQRDRVAGGAAIGRGHDDVAAVDHVAVDLDHVARSEVDRAEQGARAWCWAASGPTWYVAARAVAGSVKVATAGKDHGAHETSMAIPGGTGVALRHRSSDFLTDSRRGIG